MYNEYDPKEIEPRWQRYWEENGLYRARETGDKPKYYCLDYFPYPSGEGLHVGHCRNYVPTDVISRYRRMRGFNVLHPMGWDAFAEPTEQFAISHGIHPRETTDRNTTNFRRQMRMIGASYDWSREIDSSDPDYYRWTQWFFLLLYKRGLAYRDTNWQWWCPVCQTTLSSHEVTGGKCWRGHTGVFRREIPAWYFKITAYADELLEGLDEIDWPEPVKAMQRNWIGRSQGCEIEFRTEDGRVVIPAFTTRPDTVYGVTFFAIAPEHPLVAEITPAARLAEVQAYIAQAARKGEIERMSESRPVTGVFTDAYVINPFNQERVPVWVADYVLPSYGSGAVMGVPAHDERDYAFARRYNLPVRRVISPDGRDRSAGLNHAYVDYGILAKSGPFDGLKSEIAADRICEFAREHAFGKKMVRYRMRDWLISRQRYWGAPIPIVHCQDCGEVPVPEKELPVLLPSMEDFQPDGSGRSPLARLPEFVQTQCPKCGGPAERETDTMGGFACSSWYFLRFTSPHYDEGPFKPESMRYWMPVDLYVGGAEHAVLHLLYARFWTKVMADAGLIPFREPFAKLLNQGQLMGPDHRRMSKSRGNVITPDSVVEEYGADALRVYEMFMAPFEQDVSWNTDGINGARRFILKVWNLFSETYAASRDSSGIDPDLSRFMHQTVLKVSERIESFRFNTMISALMEFVNALWEIYQEGEWHTSTYYQALEILMLLLAPATPHLAEELWQLTGHEASVHEQEWPGWDEELVRAAQVETPVQVDGKVRDVLVIAVDADEAGVQAQALALPNVRAHIDGRQVDRVIYVPGRILSIVTRNARTGRLTSPDHI